MRKSWTEIKLRLQFTCSVKHVMVYQILGLSCLLLVAQLGSQKSGSDCEQTAAK